LWCKITGLERERARTGHLCDILRQLLAQYERGDEDLADGGDGKAQQLVALYEHGDTAAV
jgi:hypothetical protein